MISSISGILKAKAPDKVDIAVGGVGFRLLIPLSTYQNLPEVSEEVSLSTHMIVKENSIDLVGFATPLERDLFEMLITVSGVGLKLALTILSGIKAEDLLQSIATEDKSLLATISGIGPKTAGRLVLELKEKAGRISTLVGAGARPALGEMEETILALESLGFSRFEAKKAVESALRELGKSASTEDLIREALKATA